MELKRGFAAHDSASAFDNPEPAYSLNAQVQHWHPPVVLFVFVLCTSRAIRFEVIFVSVGSLNSGVLGNIREGVGKICATGITVSQGRQTKDACPGRRQARLDSPNSS